MKIINLLLVGLIVAACQWAIAGDKNVSPAVPPADQPVSVEASSDANSEEVVPTYVMSELPVSSYFGGSDPLEAFNRGVFCVVDFFYYWIYRPIGGIYSSIMPRFGIYMINNATDNLEFPRRFLSSLLQAKFKGSGIEFLRFLTNSTIGIAGLFDPATHWFGLPRQNEDFGQAFAAWGIGPGCTLQLAASTNIRDGVGMIFDYAVDIKSYFYGGQAFTFLNRGLDTFGQYDAIQRSNFDGYQAMKDYQLLVRYLQVNDWQAQNTYVDVDDKGEVILPPVRKALPGEVITPIAQYCSQTPAVDTLRSGWFQPSFNSIWAYLSLWNSDFINQGKVRKVQVCTEGEKLSFRYWLPEDVNEAPLVAILPGLGGHHTSAMALALAELCVKNKMAAVIISNTMNYEFVESTPGSPPGFPLADAEKVQDALMAVKLYLKCNEEEFKPSRFMVMGYSQGALNALFLAHREKQQPLLKVDKYLALNPPVDLIYAMSQLDGFFTQMNGLPLDEAIEQVAAGVGSYLYTSRKPSERRFRYMDENNPKKAEELEALKKHAKIDQVPISDQVAKVLIGYSFKRTLDDLIVCLHHKTMVPGLKAEYKWGRRQPLYDELAAWGYLDYAQKVMLPFYSNVYGGLSFEEMGRLAGLRAIEKTLREAKNITVIHSADDFLLSPDDRKFLVDALPGKLLVFARGGHLGNFYCQEVQDAITGILTQE